VDKVILFFALQEVYITHSSLRLNLSMCTVTPNVTTQKQGAFLDGFGQSPIARAEADMSELYPI
jgi:hypothetical protein